MRLTASVLLTAVVGVVTVAAVWLLVSTVRDLLGFIVLALARA